MKNVFRRFIDFYTNLTWPLIKLLRKYLPLKFELYEKQMECFKRLIKVAANPLAVGLPRSVLLFSVSTDALEYSVGRALFQTHKDGKWNPIGFSSRSLNAAERNYSPTERKFLEVVWYLIILRPYLLYDEFIVHTDHASMTRLFTAYDPSGR